VALWARIEHNSEHNSSLLPSGRFSRSPALPFTPAPPSPAAISIARSRSPKAGALPHFPPMCRTAQTRSVSRSSFPNCRLRENRRSTPANLRVCHSERVPLVPELQPRCQDRLCYAVRVRQPCPSILQTQPRVLNAPHSRCAGDVDLYAVFD
jgi:hypothetical protein